jgi:DNA-binding NarL/FixJ family response regulator
MERSEQLTRREQEILLLMAEGYTNPEIAAKLSLSVDTAHTHVCNILNKLGLSHRAEAAAYAALQGLIRREDLRGGIGGKNSLCPQKSPIWVMTNA